jgi:carboxyl-terminal processing protease
LKAIHENFEKRPERSREMKSSRGPSYFLAGAILILLGLTIATGAQNAPPKQPLDDASWSLFQRVFGMVLRDYVEPKTPQQVMLGALQGAAMSAGPECAYVPPEEVEAYKALAQPGPTLPLYVTKYEDFAHVLAAFPGQDAAIHPGDPLRFIGNTSTYDLTYPKVMEALRGKDGEPVKCIFLKQDAWQSYEVTLTRQAPALPRFVLLGKEGSALVLPCLEAATPQNLPDSVKASKGPVLVDLRGCASPDLKGAERWAGELLGAVEGPAYKGSLGIKKLPLSGRGLLAGRRLRVLVDGTTARAGEVLALALSGAGALLCGSPTFGYAPRVEDLPLENGGLLRLTTAFFLGSDGEMVKDKPIKPVISLTVAPDEKPEETYRKEIVRAHV